MVGRAGLEPATNGLKDRAPIGPKYLTRILLRRLDCGKQLPTTGRKSTALLRTLRDFPHNRHCSRGAETSAKNLCRARLAALAIVGCRFRGAIEGLLACYLDRSAQYLSSGCVPPQPR
jgi:hypothetical protein